MTMMMMNVTRNRVQLEIITLTYTYLILDEVGLRRRMSFNCPTRYIDPASF